MQSECNQKLVVVRSNCAPSLQELYLFKVMERRGDQIKICWNSSEEEFTLRMIPSLGVEATEWCLQQTDQKGTVTMWSHRTSDIVQVFKRVCDCGRAAEEARREAIKAAAAIAIRATPGKAQTPLTEASTDEAEPVLSAQSQAEASLPSAAPSSETATPSLTQLASSQTATPLPSLVTSSETANPLLTQAKLNGASPPVLKLTRNEPADDVRRWNPEPTQKTAEEFSRKGSSKPAPALTIAQPNLVYPFPSLLYLLGCQYQLYRKTAIPFSLLIVRASMQLRTQAGFAESLSREQSQELARLIVQIKRQTDVVTRYEDDDSYAVVLTKTAWTGAQAFALRLAKHLHAWPALKRQDRQLLVSIGVASIPDDCDDLPKLFSITSSTAARRRTLPIIAFAEQKAIRIAHKPCPEPNYLPYAPKMQAPASSHGSSVTAPSLYSKRPPDPFVCAQPTVNASCL
jgi:hypothetical protein